MKEPDCRYESDTYELVNILEAFGALDSSSFLKFVLPAGVLQKNWFGPGFVSLSWRILGEIQF